MCVHSVSFPVSATLSYLKLRQGRASQPLPTNCQHLLETGIDNNMNIINPVRQKFFTLSFQRC